MTTHQHVTLSGSHREAPADAEHIGPVPPDERVDLTLVLRRRAALPRDLVQGPDTVTADDLAARYGADPADAERVRAALEAAGLTVTDVHLGARRVSATGTAAAAGALFGAELARTRSTAPGGRRVEHRTRTGELRLPAGLEGIVVAVLGLDDRPQARTTVRGAAASGAAATVSYTPTSLAATYGFPTDADGTGHVAAIVELGGGYRASDLDPYFAGLGLARPKITDVEVGGGRNAQGRDENADTEVQLDIEVLGAAAPGTDLVVLFAPNTDRGFLDAVTTAVHASPTPSALSISWAGSEASWTRQSVDAMEEAFADAAALGVTVCVAAGDSGSADGRSDGRPHVEYPSSSPHVLAVGGTSLRTHGGPGDLVETVWNDGSRGGATGGGVSALFPLPDWQQDAGVPARPGGSGTGRGVPDVAAVADPSTGYQVRVDGTDTVVGGTSAAAPLWAALVCRLDQLLGRRLGLLQPALYAGVAAGRPAPGLRDITHGRNGAYHAATGWDACTGLGVPDGGALRDRLAGEGGR